MISLDSCFFAIVFFYFVSPSSMFGKGTWPACRCLPFTCPSRIFSLRVHDTYITCLHLPVMFQPHLFIFISLFAPLRPVFFFAGHVGDGMLWCFVYGICAG